MIAQEVKARFKGVSVTAVFTHPCAQMWDWIEEALRKGATSIVIGPART